jgi:hypothetical protein
MKIVILHYPPASLAAAVAARRRARALAVERSAPVAMSAPGRTGYLRLQSRVNRAGRN